MYCGPTEWFSDEGLWAHTDVQVRHSGRCSLICLGLLDFLHEDRGDVHGGWKNGFRIRTSAPDSGLPPVSVSIPPVPA